MSSDVTHGCHTRRWAVGVVGGGVVGGATALAYAEWAASVKVYDALPERCTAPLDEVLACDVVFVCLPTPPLGHSSELDTIALDRFFSSIKDSQANLVLRSTVPIGTTRFLSVKYNLPNLAHSPEFLTARCAALHASLPARNIIGRLWEDQDTLSPTGCPRKLWELYQSRWPHVTCYSMMAEESEAVKLFQNGFFAVKVAYWNEVKALADAKGLHWNMIVRAVLADGRIHPSHTQVPGPDGRPGFGGSCLPKDLAQLVAHLGHNSVVTSAALRRNLTDRGDQ